MMSVARFQLVLMRICSKLERMASVRNEIVAIKQFDPGNKLTEIEVFEDREQTNFSRNVPR